MQWVDYADLRRRLNIVAVLAWMNWEALAEGNPNEQTLLLSTLGQRLEPDSLTEYVRHYINSADIGKKGSCHLFRHTMATLMLENGADIRYIQAMLGHADLSTTQIYTQVSIRKLQQIHALTHPADNPKPDEESEETVDVKPEAMGNDSTPATNEPKPTSPQDEA